MRKRGAAIKEEDSEERKEEKMAWKRGSGICREAAKICKDD